MTVIESELLLLVMVRRSKLDLEPMQVEDKATMLAAEASLTVRCAA